MKKIGLWIGLSLWTCFGLVGCGRHSAQTDSTLDSSSIKASALFAGVLVRPLEVPTLDVMTSLRSFARDGLTLLREEYVNSTGQDMMIWVRTQSVLHLHTNIEELWNGGHRSYNSNNVDIVPSSIRITQEDTGYVKVMNVLDTWTPIILAQRTSVEVDWLLTAPVGSSRCETLPYVNRDSTSETFQALGFEVSGSFLRDLRLTLVSLPAPDATADPAIMDPKSVHLLTSSPETKDLTLGNLSGDNDPYMFCPNGFF